MQLLQEYNGVHPNRSHTSSVFYDTILVYRLLAGLIWIVREILQTDLPFCLSKYLEALEWPEQAFFVYCLWFIQHFIIHTANHWQICLPLSAGIPLNNSTFKAKLETHPLKIASLKNSQFSSFILRFLFWQRRNTADKMLEHLLADFPVRMTQFVQKWQGPQFIL